MSPPQVVLSRALALNVPSRGSGTLSTGQAEAR